MEVNSGDCFLTVAKLACASNILTIKNKKKKSRACTTNNINLDDYKYIIKDFGVKKSSKQSSGNAILETSKSIYSAHCFLGKKKQRPLIPVDLKLGPLFLVCN